MRLGGGRARDGREGPACRGLGQIRVQAVAEVCLHLLPARPRSRSTAA